MCLGSAPVTRRPLSAVVLTTILAGFVVAGTVGAAGSSDRTAGPSGPTGSSFQPDGWIKLCGQSNGCKIDPPPHPWRGKDIYNETGRRQTVAVDINEGEGVRFWIVVQNDSSEPDTVRIQGCRGNQTFELVHVLLGKHRNQDPGAKELTRRYKEGTLKFDLASGEKAIFTLQIITHFNKGRTYGCRTEMTSEGDPERVDLVIAEMTTF